jgi:hypothetical protein
MYSLSLIACDNFQYPSGGVHPTMVLTGLKLLLCTSLGPCLWMACMRAHTHAQTRSRTRVTHMQLLCSLSALQREPRVTCIQLPLGCQRLDAAYIMRDMHMMLDTHHTRSTLARKRYDAMQARVSCSRKRGARGKDNAREREK